MPMFILYTNIVDTPPDFLSKASKLVSTLTGKDEARVCAIINDGLKMSFAGTTDACGIVQLHSIGLQSSEHSRYSAAIAKLLAEIGECQKSHMELCWPCGDSPISFSSSFSYSPSPYFH